MEDIVHRYQKIYNLNDLLINDIDRYMNIVK